MIDLLIGFVAASVIGWLAFNVKALTLSGALASVIVGTIVFGAGGPKASVVLIVFFVSGSALSKLPGAKIKEESGRDWVQVAANGLVPALAVALSRLFPEHQRMFAMMFLGSMATAAADTWATEIGTRYGGQARDSLTLRRMEPGISGGITLAGLCASAVGALLIGVLGVLPLRGLEIAATWKTAIIVTVAGIIASLFDSFFGSSFQAKYWCATCGKTVESRSHSHLTTLVKGFSWMTNSLVNFLTVIIGALIAALWP